MKYILHLHRVSVDVFINASIELMTFKSKGLIEGKNMKNMNKIVGRQHFCEDVRTRNYPVGDGSGANDNNT